jgi:hypothetical protein
VIGIDFDNTIACYDELMHAIALSRGLIDAAVPVNKKVIRDTIRRLPDGESHWRGVQVTAYGPRMQEARPADGVADFFAECLRRRVPVYIVSHKTEFANFGEPGVNLRVAASAWLDRHGFRVPVFFESTRAEKADRIRTLGVTHFVDDLEETFREPGFPKGVRQLLLTPAATWRQIQDDVFRGPDLRHLSALIGTTVTGGERIGKGGNNRIYSVTGDKGARYAVKTYLQPTADGRDRLDVEYSSLAFLWNHGVRSIPRPVAADVDRRIAVYDFIQGAQVDAGTAAEADVDQVVSFAGRLKRLLDAPAAAGLPPASEACFSLSALDQNLRHRLDRISAATGRESSFALLQEFLCRDLAPALDAAVVRARAAAGDDTWHAELPLSDRTLSPSDMGFHNALRRDDGSIVFLDFEYFGVDDPVKLLADFVLHPAMSLRADLGRAFVERMLAEFGDGDRIRTRFAISYPLYALKWCLILLNEFVPAHLLRREFAHGIADREERRLGQLDKARDMLARVTSEVVYA